MIPLWIFVIALMVTAIAGFIGGLTWQGRSQRNAHSFYDPAVSVSATIERATSTPKADRPVREDKLTHEYGQGDDTAEHPADTFDYVSEIDAYPPVEIDGPVVRYYFDEQQRQADRDAHKTVRLEPVRVPPQQPHSWTLPPQTSKRSRLYLDRVARPTSPRAQ